MIINDFIWVILAAGNSTRLGQPKQLLKLGSQSLIQHQVQTLLSTGLPVCVVSGAVDINSDITPHANLSILHNPEWRKGMGTSVTLAQKNSHSEKYWLGISRSIRYYHRASSRVLPVLETATQASFSKPVQTPR